MKGAIFTGMAEFVEQEHSLTLWLEVVDSCTLASKGEYLATEIYDDEEFFTLSQALSEKLGTPAPDLYRSFGVYFFPTLMGIVTKYASHVEDLFDFIIIVDSVIHTEVQKADPLAYTPTLLYDRPDSEINHIRFNIFNYT